MHAMTLAPAPATRVTKQALEAVYSAGHDLHARGMYRQAAAVFRIMILSAPFDERGYIALGSCHEGLGEEEIALTIYETAIETAATSAHSHVARARLLAGCSQRELAEEAFDEAERQAEREDDDYVRTLLALERGRP